jgi:hypothetical protein
MTLFPTITSPRGQPTAAPWITQASSSSPAPGNRLVEVLRQSLCDQGVMGNWSGRHDSVQNVAAQEVAAQAASRWEEALAEEGIHLPGGPRNLGWWEQVALALAALRARKARSAELLLEAQEDSSLAGIRSRAARAISDELSRLLERQGHGLPRQRAQALLDRSILEQRLAEPSESQALALELSQLLEEDESSFVLRTMLEGELAPTALQEGYATWVLSSAREDADSICAASDESVEAGAIEALTLFLQRQAGPQALPEVSHAPTRSLEEVQLGADRGAPGSGRAGGAMRVALGLEAVPRTERDCMRALSRHSAVQGVLDLLLPEGSRASPTAVVEHLRQLLRASGEVVPDSMEVHRWLEAIERLWSRWGQIEALGQALMDRYLRVQRLRGSASRPMGHADLESIEHLVQAFVAASPRIRLENRWSLELTQTLDKLERVELELWAQSPQGEWLRAELMRNGWFVPTRAGSPDVGLLLNESADLLGKKGVPSSLLPRSLGARCDLLSELSKNSAVRALILQPDLAGTYEAVLRLHNDALRWRADATALLLAVIEQRLSFWGPAIQPPLEFGARARLVLDLEAKRAEVELWDRWLQRPGAVALRAQHGISMASAMAQRLALGASPLNRLVDVAQTGPAVPEEVSNLSLIAKMDRAASLQVSQWAWEAQLLSSPALERMVRIALDPPARQGGACSLSGLAQQLARLFEQADPAPIGDAEKLGCMEAWTLELIRSQPAPVLRPDEPDALLWEVWRALVEGDESALARSMNTMHALVSEVLREDERPTDPLEFAVVASEIRHQEREIPHALLAHMQISRQEIIRRRLRIELQTLQPERVEPEWDIATLSLELFCLNQTRAIDGLWGKGTPMQGTTCLSVYQVCAALHLAQAALKKLPKYLINDLGLNRPPLAWSLAPHLLQGGAAALSLGAVLRFNNHAGEKRLTQELKTLGIPAHQQPEDRLEKERMAADINLLRSLEAVWWPHLPPRIDPSMSDRDYAALVRAWLSCRPDEVKQTTALNLSGLGLTRLPPEYERCSELSELNLSGNRCAVEDLIVLRAFKKLRVLNLSHNGLKGVPCWSRSAEMHELDLSHNELEKLGESVWERIGGCRLLDLSHNQFASWPLPPPGPWIVRALLIHGNALQTRKRPWTLPGVRCLSVDEGVEVPADARPSKGALNLWIRPSGSGPDQFIFKAITLDGLSAWQRDDLHALPPRQLMILPYLKIGKPTVRPRRIETDRTSPLHDPGIPRRERLAYAAQLTADDLRDDPQAPLALFGDLLHRDAQNLCSPSQYAALWSLLDQCPPRPSYGTWPASWQASEAALRALHEEVEGQSRWARWWLFTPHQELGQQLEMLPDFLQRHLLLAEREASRLMASLTRSDAWSNGQLRRSLIQLLVRAAQKPQIAERILQLLQKRPEALCRQALPLWFFGWPMSAPQRKHLLQLLTDPSVSWNGWEQNRILAILARWTPEERRAAAAPSAFADVIQRTAFSEAQRALVLGATNEQAAAASYPTQRAIFCSEEFLAKLAELKPDDQRSVEQWMVETAQGAALNPRPIPYHLRDGAVADHDHLNSSRENVPLVLSYRRGRPDQPLQLLHLEFHTRIDRTSREWPAVRDEQLGCKFQVLPLSANTMVEWEPSFELRRACTEPHLIGNRALGSATRAVYLSPLAIEQLSWLSLTTRKALLNRLRGGALGELFWGQLSSGHSPFNAAFPALDVDQPPAWGSPEEVQMLCVDSDRKEPLQIAGVVSRELSCRLEELTAQVETLASNWLILHPQAERAYRVHERTWLAIAPDEPRQMSRRVRALAEASHPPIPPSPGPRLAQPRAVVAAAAGQRVNFRDELDQLLGNQISLFPAKKTERLRAVLAAANPLACLLGHRAGQARDGAVIRWLCDLPSVALRRLHQELLAIDQSLAGRAPARNANQHSDWQPRLMVLREKIEQIRSLCGIEQIQSLPECLRDCWELKREIAEHLCQDLPDQEAIRSVLAWLAPDLDLSSCDSSTLHLQVRLSWDWLKSYATARKGRSGKSDRFADLAGWVIELRGQLLVEILDRLKRIQQQHAAQGAGWAQPDLQAYQNLMLLANSPEGVIWSSRGRQGNGFLIDYLKKLTKLDNQLQKQATPRAEETGSRTG